MSENESLEITKLEGTNNYTQWKFKVKIALEGKDLFGYVDETEKKPNAEKPAELKAYNKSVSRAKTIILCSINQKLRCYLVNCTSAKDMWNKLSELYGDTSADAKQAIWKKFYAFHITEDETVRVQLERFESIVKKLDEVDKKPSDEAIVSKLLTSLPEKFELFTLAWECTHKADRTQKTLIARLIKEDNRLAEKEATTLALRVKNASLNDAKNDAKSDAKSDAKKKKRFKKEIEELKKRTRCGVCKERGHWARECPQKNSEKSDNAIKTSTALVSDITTSYQCASAESGRDYFIADTGAGRHMTFRKDFFFELRPNPVGSAVKVADDCCIDAPGVGTIIIQERLDGVLYEREIKNVLYVPDLGCNLLSIGTVNRNGLKFCSDEKGCEIRDKQGNLIARGVPQGNIFRMLSKVKVSTECNAVQADGQGMLNLWHARMGHVNVRVVKQTCEQLGIDGISQENFEFCEGCVLGKQTRRPHPSSASVSNYGPGEKIHSDVCGPINVQSPSGTRFFVVFKDEDTRFRKVYFLRHKSEVFDQFKKFEAFVSTQLGTKIKVLCTDNGTEYTCEKMQSFLKDKGIINEFSAPYIHEQNGRAEREIRTLVESARSMLDVYEERRHQAMARSNKHCVLLAKQSIFETRRDAYSIRTMVQAVTCNKTLKGVWVDRLPECTQRETPEVRP